MRDESNLNLDALLNPARAFAHPNDVLNDPGLTIEEKRAILASWASDACAVEAAPALRCGPGGGVPVQFDEVMDALQALDRLSIDPEPAAASDRRESRCKVIATAFRRRSGDGTDSDRSCALS